MVHDWQLQQYRKAPTREAATKLFDQVFYARQRPADPNDIVYAFESSRDFNAPPDLENIKAPLYAVNSADEVNPPSLGILERETKRVRSGRISCPAYSGNQGGMAPTRCRQSGAGT